MLNINCDKIYHLFVGLQWGYVLGDNTAILPISFKSWDSRITLGTIESNDDGTSASIVIDNGCYTTSSFRFIAFSNGTINRKIHWLTIGF